MSDDIKYYHRIGDCHDRLMYMRGAWYIRKERKWVMHESFELRDLMHYVESVIEHLERES